MTGKPLPYSPALDGLRAIAILLVALFHARAPAGLGGFIGVDVFFVLSGYLITALLLGELDDSGRVNVRRFYIRRLWRLSPALLTVVVAYLLFAPFLWPSITDHRVQAVAAALYLSDLTVALWGTPNLLSHTWSLAIEAHFYLIWPFALTFAARRWNPRSLTVALGALYMLATLWRWTCVVTNQEWREVYYRFDTHVSGLVLGSWLAASLRYNNTRMMLQRAAPWLLWLPVGAVVCLQYRWDDMWMLVYGLSIAELGALGILIAVQVPSGQIAGMLSMAPLVWMGKMSYGVYLWHYPIFRYLREYFRWDGVLLIGLPLSVALAAASYYVIESWARKRVRMTAVRTDS